MIEIIKRNGIWEAYIDGGLEHYDEDLGQLLRYLASRADQYIEDFKNNN
jgi:hypothetical protein